MIVLAGLLELSDDDWQRPLTNIIPEFNKGQTDGVSPQWDKITPWTLASRLGGIKSTGVISDLLVQFDGAAVPSNVSVTDLEIASGLPPVNPTVLGPCVDVQCTPEQFIQSLRSPAPVFLPNTTPGYSILGMMILGTVISHISGKPYDTLCKDAIFEPLGVTSSFANAPKQGPLLNRSVVAGPFVGSWSFPRNNPTLPSGGILSTINDLNKLGVGILNAALLSEEKTRAWMKPQTHTASLSYSIGHP